MSLHSFVPEMLSALDLRPFGFIWGPDCGRGNQKNQMFEGLTPTREWSYAQPDGALADLVSVPAVVEIEDETGEYGFDPNRLNGKWSSVAQCEYLIRPGIPPLHAPAVTFIQVVNNAGLVKNSCKLLQYRNVERSIRSRLPWGYVVEYHLFDGTEDEFRTGEVGERLRAVVLDLVRRLVKTGQFV